MMLLVNKKIVGGAVTQGVDYMTVGLLFFYLFIDLLIYLIQCQSCPFIASFQGHPMKVFS